MFGEISGVIMANDLFRQGVAAVLQEWEALDIAVKNGFGGSFGVEKARWMEAATVQYFQENDNLEDDEIEDFLATVVNQEFDTIVDDGSLPSVAKKLCWLYAQCINGREDEVRDFVSKSKPCSVASTVQKQASPQPDGDGEVSMEPEGKEEEQEEQEEEDGWEKVTYKKRR
eukprot:Em0022g936a